MSDENKEILLAPLSNIISAQTGKGGFGNVKIAVSNEIIDKFLNEDGYYVGGLIFANSEQFKQIQTGR
jgi:hypothetical protein